MPEMPSVPRVSHDLIFGNDAHCLGETQRDNRQVIVAQTQSARAWSGLPEGAGAGHRGKQADRDRYAEPDGGSAET